MAYTGYGGWGSASGREDYWKNLPSYNYGDWYSGFGQSGDLSTEDKMFAWNTGGIATVTVS